MWNEHSLLVKSPKLPVGLSFGRCRPGLTGIFRRYPLFSERSRQKKPRNVWCPLTGVTLQVSEPPADIASAVSAGDFFLSHAPLAVD